MRSKIMTAAVGDKNHVAGKERRASFSPNGLSGKAVRLAMALGTLVLISISVNALIILAVGSKL